MGCHVKQVIIFGGDEVKYIHHYTTTGNTTLREIQHTMKEDKTIIASGFLYDGWGGTVSLYVNGTLITSATCPSGSIYTSFYKDDLAVKKGDVVRVTGQGNHGSGYVLLNILL